MDFIVQEIPKEYCQEWLLYKHYAHRKPGNIQFSFGLLDDKNILQGICTFGTPPRMLNNGKNIFNNYSIKVFELNRLCVNDDLPKNTLSYFVSKSLDLLPRPCCVVSYADSNMNHRGYIYQATNWLYTGCTAPRRKFINELTGKEIHERTLVSQYGTSSEIKIQEYNNIKIIRQLGKHRYFYFCGTKLDKKIMKRNFKYKILPYPKGDNHRYDSSFETKEIKL